MRFPEFFESARANVQAHNKFDDDRTLVSNPGDGGQPFPAPWFTDPWELSDDVEITTIEIPDGAPDSDGPPIDLDAHDWGESGYPENGAEAVAFYVPWHSSPQQWGIYFLERPFFAFVTQIATIAGLPPNAVAPVVLRQVLFHELTHFRFEVVGSELEDVLGRALYLNYLRYRFGRPVGRLSGPIEESLATWSEVRFARGKLQSFLRPKPPSYLPAVESAATQAPPGYCDWAAAASDRAREGLVAAVAGLIADTPLTTGGWGNWLTPENKASVPRHWVGDPGLLPNIGALRKTAPQVTVRVFERWLKAQGITPVMGGNGSHRKFEYAGRREGYGTSGNNDRLYLKDAKRLRKFFEYATVTDFLVAVSNKVSLPT